jgi:hypothetical protein
MACISPKKAGAVTSPQDVYRNLKARAYGAARLTSGCGDREAQSKGYADVFDMIMSNSSHSRQTTFVALLPTIFAEKECQDLLDGMAWEYVKLEKWATYLSLEVAEIGQALSEQKGTPGDRY